MFKKTSTHYDILSVSHDAPMEVIDAAYRTLSKKHHPDLNRNDPDAARRMAEINASYDVLSDFGKRFQYDKKLQKEFEDAERARHAAKAQPQHKNFGRNPPPPKRSPFVPTKLRGIGFIVWLAALFVLLASVFLTQFQNLRSISIPQKIAMHGTFTRPATAPNGQPWPGEGGYIAGYAVGGAKGASTIVVDNSVNDADIFVKLFFADDPDEKSLRVFFIPHSASFTLKDLGAARYVIQYMDLNTGNMYKTAPFTLSDKPGNIRMKLRKVAYNISVNEF